MVVRVKGETRGGGSPGFVAPNPIDCSLWYVINSETEPPPAEELRIVPTTSTNPLTLLGQQHWCRGSSRPQPCRAAVRSSQVFTHLSSHPSCPTPPRQPLDTPSCLSKLTPEMPSSSTVLTRFYLLLSDVTFDTRTFANLCICRTIHTASSPTFESDESQRCSNRVQGQDNGPKKVCCPHPSIRPSLPSTPLTPRHSYCVRPNSGRIEPGQSVEVQGMCCRDPSVIDF